ncbi:MAG: CoA transferase, partial [Actinomycetota bacterium]
REIARESSAEADSHLIPWVGARTKDELRRLGHQFGFPTAPVRSVGAAIEDPQFTFRRFFVEGSGELAGLTYPGVPWRILQASPASEPAPDTSAPGQPLAGLRVLDLSWVWSGPMVTSILADLGAEVFKVENPERPDPARARGPARRDGVPVSGHQLELSPYFNQLGHGKKSINIDLTKDEGRELVLELARHCDVVVENMRPGVMKRLGIGYDELRKVNQRVVMLSMSTLGQEGPSSQIMGYGMVMSGLAGLESIVGYGDETMGMFNLAISDPTAGSHAIVALLAAIHRQRVDGQSAWIDLSQTECTMEALLEQILETQLNGSTVVPGNSHTSFSPHGVFRSAGNDEWIAVAARTDAERDRMRDLIGGGADLDESLEKWLVSRTAADAATDLRSIGVSASPVMSFEALEADGWFERRGFVRDLGHPDLGPQTIGAAPWSLNGHRISPSRSSPYLGEHGREILATVLGLDTRAIDELVGRGVVGEPSPGADRARNNFDERQEA